MFKLESFSKNSMSEKIRLVKVKGFDETYNKIYPKLKEKTLAFFFNITSDLELITGDAGSLLVDVRLSPLEIYAKTGNIIDVSICKDSKLELERVVGAARIYVPVYEKSKLNGGKEEKISFVIRYN